MPRFAETTQVPIERTRTEIEQTLFRYGAQGFLYGQDGLQVQLGFRVGRRVFRMALPLPDPEAAEVWDTPTGKRRSNEQAARVWKQAVKQRWRALLLVIKAKLEAIEIGITTFEDEFLAFTVLPGGHTVGEWAAPQLAAATHAGDLPPLLQPPSHAQRGALPPGADTN
jgi:hypothetical protein